MANTHHSQNAGTTKRQRFCVRVPMAEHGRIKRDATRKGISMAEYCRRALLSYLVNRATLAEPAKAAKKMGDIANTRAKAPTYAPTKSELTMIRRGEAAITRGESVSLTDFLHGMDRNRRKAGTKVKRKISG